MRKHAPVNTGMVSQILRDRGFGVAQDKDLLRTVLREVDAVPELSSRMRSAARAAQFGTETDDERDLLMAVQMCARPSTVNLLRETGSSLEMGKLVQLLLKEPRWHECLNRGDLAGPVADELRGLLVEAATPAGSMRSADGEAGEDSSDAQDFAEVDEGSDAENGSKEPELPLQHRVFGLSGAATFELCVLPRADHRGCVVHSVRLEMAQPAMGQGRRDAGGRKYAWGEKLMMVFTARELVRAAAASAGLFGEPQEFKRPHVGKSCVIARQEGLIYLRMEAGNRKIGVPIVESDIYGVAMLFQEAMRLNAPSSDAVTRLEMMRCMARVVESGMQGAGRNGR